VFDLCKSSDAPLQDQQLYMLVVDVAARRYAGDGPIAALVGGSSIGSALGLQHRKFNTK